METHLRNPRPAKSRVSVESKGVPLELGQLAEAFNSYLETLGDFVQTLGTIERKYPGMIEEVRNMSRNPAMLRDFTESVSSKSLGVFFRVMVQVMSVGSELNRLSTLSPERKIELGKDLKKVAVELASLQVEKVTKN